MIVHTLAIYVCKALTLMTFCNKGEKKLAASYIRKDQTKTEIP